MRLTDAQARRLGIGDVVPKRPQSPSLETAECPANPPGHYVMTIASWRPALDNQLVGQHWAVAHRRKRRDVDAIATAALLFAVPRATGRRRLTLTIRGRFGRLPDDPAPLKSLLDALVRNGLLVDDSRDWLELVWPPTYERSRYTETVVVLEDVSC